MNMSRQTIIVLVSSTINFISASQLFAANSQSSQSVEFMCKAKAKELAAETYKNCVTEIKQTQVKSLRKEYEDKLAELKKHYEKELKKISSGQVSTSTSQQPVQTTLNHTNSEVSENTEIQTKDSSSLDKKNREKSDKYIKRFSGARELPLKNENNTDASSVEVVEIPLESE